MPIFAQSEYLVPERVGTITDSRVKELSGMVCTSKHEGIYWIHNDSDDTARIFAINEQGIVLAEIRITGAGANDWEDISRGAGPDPNKTYLYLADTGNNNLSRSELVIYRIEEPELPHLGTGQVFNSGPSTAIRFRYPDGNFNCEAFVADPDTPGLYLITKVDGTAGAYRFPSPLGIAGTQTLVKIRNINLGDLITAADVSRDGRKLLVRTYSQVREYVISENESFSALFSKSSRVLPDNNSEAKSESICFDFHDREYLTSNEGNPAPIHRARLRIPQAHCEAEPFPGDAFTFTRGDLVNTTELTLTELEIADLAHLEAIVNLQEDLPCDSAGDVEDDGDVDANDVNHLADRLAKGIRPRRPFPSPGVDPTADSLLCYEEEPQTLIPLEANWKYWEDSTPPDTTWSESSFDDSDWSEGPAKIGFGGVGISTELNSVRRSHASIFLRHTFQAIPLTSSEYLVLRADFNDGFVAFLNGVEVARSGIGTVGFLTQPGQLARFHSGGKLEEFVICKDLIRSGENTLSVQVHNRTVSDSTLFFQAELLIRTPKNPSPPVTSGPSDSRAEVNFDYQQPLTIGDEIVIPIVYNSTQAIQAFSLVIDYDPDLIGTLRFDLPTPQSQIGLLQVSTSISKGQIYLVYTGVSDPFPSTDFDDEPQELLKWSIRPRDIGTGETSVSFGLRDSTLPLDTLFLTEEGELIYPRSQTLDLSLSLSDTPFIREVLDAQGKPGDQFFVLGNRFDDLNLEVWVCGQKADFIILQPGTLLLVTAPECDQIGWVEVEVRNDLGRFLTQDGFFYESSGPLWIRGDSNGDEKVDISDAVGLLSELFLGIPTTPLCPTALDANNDTIVDISDAIFLLSFLFQGTVEISEPYETPIPCTEV